MIFNSVNLLLRSLLWLQKSSRFLSLNSTLYIPVVVLGCATHPIQVVSSLNSWKKQNKTKPLCDYIEKTWYPCRQTGIKHIYRRFSLISVSSISTKEPLVLGRSCCHTANCLPGWTMADRRWRGGRKWQECCPELLLIRSFEPFVLQKVKSRAGAGAGVQTKQTLPPLDLELAVVIFPQLSNLRGIEKWSILGSCYQIPAHCKM